MSNLTVKAELDCAVTQGCDAVELMIQPREKALGGISVRRVLPTVQRRMVGPWIFFDHMGPARFSAGEGIDVPPHPHVNIATVTYLFDGEILHRDSLGSLQPISPGDINLMVAGQGIVHSERERPEVREVDHKLHGLQLWLALPEADEEVEPAFYHYPAADIPTTEVDGVPLRVMMGTAYGQRSPVKTYAETLYVEAHLQVGQRITLPEAEERAVYVASGCLQTGGTALTEHSLVVFGQGSNIVLEAVKKSRIAIIGGDKMGKRYIEWNFVSSRKQRIEQAKQDWREGRFPLVSGDDGEPIALPE